MTVLVDERVAVVGHVMLAVPLASMPYFDVGSIGVGRPEIGNVIDIASRGWVVLSEGIDTLCRGLRDPMPA